MKRCKQMMLFAILACLMLLTAAGYAESKKYGKVNHTSVRFRKQAESTDSWATLDKGWPVEILGTKKAGGVEYYHVVCGTPRNPDRQYWGYIQKQYVTRTSSKPATPAASSSSSSSSSSKATVKTESGTVKTTADKVRLRKGPSADADTKTQVKEGTTLKYSAVVTQDGVKWYKVKYNGDTCYIMAKFCKTVPDKEASSAKNTSSAKETCKDAQKPSDPSTTAVTTREKVVLRASGSSNGKQVAVLTNKRTVCTLKGSTTKADGYVWYKVKADGKTGWVRGDLLRILSKDEAKTFKDSSQYKGTLYTPELAKWSSVKDIFYKGCVAKVTDVSTGISFKVRRWSGGLHADVEPYTAADTKAMCKIYGVSKAQDISDRNMYQRRSILVTIGSHSYAASMYGVPHNYPEGDTIDDNNFKGQFCIHFVDSQVHRTKVVDSDHQRAIKYAYSNAESVLSKKGYKFK